MRRLTLVGFTEDGSEILFTAEPPKTGPESRDGTFVLALDDQLQAALRRDRSRLGQLQIADSAALRPRDIQARVRSGQSPEQVAAEAGIPAARVMAFALPVMAEREHIAAVARECVLRHPAGAGPTPGAGATQTAGRTLGEAVGAAVERLGGTAEDLLWDSYRREDGTWIVSVAGAAAGEAQFAFVPVARSVVAENAVARDLLSEPEPAAPAIPVSYDRSFHSSRVSRPGPDEPAASELDEGTEPTARLDAAESAASARRDQDRRTDRTRGHPAREGGRGRRTLRYLAFRDEPGDAEDDRSSAQPLGAVLDPRAEPVARGTRPARPDEPGPDETDPEGSRSHSAGPGAREPEPHEPEPLRPGQRSLRRPAVPSWDEIMFGRKDQTP